MRSHSLSLTLSGDFIFGLAVFDFCRLRRFGSFGVKSSYAEAGVVDESKSAPIDVVADIKPERVRTDIHLLSSIWN